MIKMTDKKGRFGVHGGQYIPETLMNAVIELEEAYKEADSMQERMNIHMMIKKIDCKLEEI